MSHVVEDAIASQVKDVMTTKVSTVQPGTPFKVIAAQLREHRVGALPAVDDDGYVRGVVIADSFFIDPATFAVTVGDGVVTLAGPAELSLVRHAIAQQVRHLEGVVVVRERTEPENN